MSVSTIVDDNDIVFALWRRFPARTLVVVPADFGEPFPFLTVQSLEVPLLMSLTAVPFSLPAKALSIYLPSSLGFWAKILKWLFKLMKRTKIGKKSVIQLRISC